MLYNEMLIIQKQYFYRFYSERRFLKNKNQLITFVQ